MISQFDIMAELAADRSSWYDVRHYPATVTCRRMLRLADFAAAEPGRWDTCRMSWECPELSYREIAALTGRGMSVVQRHVAPVDLSDPGDFTPGELGVYPGDPLPGWLRPRTARPAAEGEPSLTYRRGRSLADFAAAAPVQWRVMRYAAMYPDATAPEIAAALGVGERAAREWMQPVRLTDDEIDDEIL